MAVRGMPSEEPVRSALQCDVRFGRLDCVPAGDLVRPRRPLRRDFNRITVYADLRIATDNRGFLWIERMIS
jgi:hypothetical protein